MSSLRRSDRGVASIDRRELKYVSKKILAFAVSSTVAIVGAGHAEIVADRSCSAGSSAIGVKDLSSPVSSIFPHWRGVLEAAFDSREVLPVDRSPTETLPLLK